jgi:hypothetical protein
MTGMLTLSNLLAWSLQVALLVRGGVRRAGAAADRGCPRCDTPSFAWCCSSACCCPSCSRLAPRRQRRPACHDVGGVRAARRSRGRTTAPQSGPDVFDAYAPPIVGGVISARVCWRGSSGWRLASGACGGCAVRASPQGRGGVRRSAAGHRRPRDDSLGGRTRAARYLRVPRRSSCSHRRWPGSRRHPAGGRGARAVARPPARLALDGRRGGAPRRLLVAPGDVDPALAHPGHARGGGRSAGHRSHRLAAHVCRRAPHLRGGVAALRLDGLWPSASSGSPSRSDLEGGRDVRETRVVICGADPRRGDRVLGLVRGAGVPDAGGCRTSSGRIRSRRHAGPLEQRAKPVTPENPIPQTHLARAGRTSAGAGRSRLVTTHRRRRCG